MCFGNFFSSKTDVKKIEDNKVTCSLSLIDHSQKPILQITLLVNEVREIRKPSKPSESSILGMQIKKDSLYADLKYDESLLSLDGAWVDAKSTVNSVIEKHERGNKNSPASTTRIVAGAETIKAKNTTFNVKKDSINYTVPFESKSQLESFLKNLLSTKLITLNHKTQILDGKKVTIFLDEPFSPTFPKRFLQKKKNK